VEMVHTEIAKGGATCPVALHFAYYNFCRAPPSLRITPAMEAGLVDHVWTITELINGKG
jgi:hypothetical protein